jgi:hypothetical protein
MEEPDVDFVGGQSNGVFRSNLWNIEEKTKEKNG